MIWIFVIVLVLAVISFMQHSAVKRRNKTVDKQAKQDAQPEYLDDF